MVNQIFSKEIKLYFQKKKYNTKIKIWFFIPIIFLILIIDSWTKIVAQTKLLDGQTINFLPHFINFSLIENKGSAYGQNQNNFLLTVIVAIIITTITFITFIFFYNPLYLTGIAFIIAGSVGNLINRIWNHGFVTDFLTFDLFSSGSPWFIFNLADFSICFGIAFISLSILIVDIIIDKLNK